MQHDNDLGFFFLCTFPPLRLTLRLLVDLLGVSSVLSASSEVSTRGHQNYCMLFVHVGLV